MSLKVIYLDNMLDLDPAQKVNSMTVIDVVYYTINTLIAEKCANTAKYIEFAVIFSKFILVILIHIYYVINVLPDSCNMSLQ